MTSEPPDDEEVPLFDEFGEPVRSESPQAEPAATPVAATPSPADATGH